MSAKAPSKDRCVGKAPQSKPYYRDLNEKDRKRGPRNGGASKGPRGGGNRGKRISRDQEPAAKAKQTESDKWMAMQHAFEGLTDPRVNRRRRHLLIDIVVIAVSAVIAGAEAWKDMSLWASCNQTWLQGFLQLPNGIPSRDTFRRVVSRLDPQEFQRCFVRWVSAISRAGKGRIVAVDGKTLRRSMDASREGRPLHIVSAWATEQKLSLGQVAVDSKSNEITAIPELLRLLEIKGALITIDAMGCQKEIAREIIKQEADYSLMVKGNQEHLHEDLIGHFNKCLENGFAKIKHQEHKTEERKHGRTETRHYYVSDVPDTLRNAEAWSGLKSVGLVISERTVGDECTGNVRYYINSFAVDVKRFAAGTRGHWGIENSLHWIMDVTFDEDHSRIRKDLGAENMSWLRRFAVTLLTNEPSVQDTVRAKRRRAMWNVNYLETVLMAAHSLN